MDQGTDRPDTIYICLSQLTDSQHLAAALRAHGHHARAFASAAVLRTAVAHRPPAVIVAAVDPPAGEDGPPWRTTRDPGATTLILAVPDAGVGSYRRALDAGADAVVPQPVAPGPLRRVLAGLGDTGEPGRTALIGTAASIPDALATDGLAVTTFEPDDDALLLRLERWRPDAVIVDAELTTTLVPAIRQRPSLTAPVLATLHAGDPPRCPPPGVDLALGPGHEAVLAPLLRRRIQANRRRITNACMLEHSDPATGLMRGDALLAEVATATATADRVPSTVLHIALTTDGDTPAEEEAAIITAADAMNTAVPPLGPLARLGHDRFAFLARGVPAGACGDLAARLADAAEGAVPTVSAQVDARGVTPASDPEGLLSASGPLPQPGGHRSSGEWRRRIESALNAERLATRSAALTRLDGGTSHLARVHPRILDEAGSPLPPGDYGPAIAGSRLAMRLDREVLECVLDGLAASADIAAVIVPLGVGTLADPAYPGWLRGRCDHHGVAQGAVIPEVAAAEIATPALAANIPDPLAVSGVADAARLAEIAAALPLAFIRLHEALLASDGSVLDDTALRAITGHARAHDVAVIAPPVARAGTLASLWAAGVNLVEEDTH
ncbi:hypothetical protein NYO91_06930 [Arhodomonas aquaeolei]|uniref:hypothetical protein n=1 Tax=Arhodomonas aquaeolei TaxID=2369 RepID=UPI002167575F|nr:hypothetical protein [Arhodomonas aquaeolei]MCS4503811.1 hypothetical protein [Arhodomonas aquaeolei]